ncbi:Transcriptional regulator, MarR family [Labilithrix luteola]|uniref:Transcriptional regulator, MarR family n=1 Tax=Labilithrix luteola TaxID=1391654 RepID=A0A0K1QH25_9BACT|nr:MarR family transcriptional regulator [Labilithrix luteola]AKV04725.1 Transcriptional regulator, MarR family [Labilithrix luteola]
MAATERVEARSTKRASTQKDSVAESVSIWFRLLSCHTLMMAELRRELENPRGKTSALAKVTLPRFDLLAALDHEDGQTLAALSRALLVTAGNVTGLVDRAERDGLVERRPDPSDRRVGHVWLTTRGRSLVRKLLPLHAGQIHELLGHLPIRERRALRRALGALRDHLPRTRA